MDTDHRELLHTCAVGADTAGEPLDLGGLWEDLTTGRTRIADHFFTAERCYLILTPLEPARRARRGTRKARLLQRSLLEGGQKAVAVDLGLAASTIAVASKRCLGSMGLPCVPSKVPPLLVMAAYAAREPGAFLDCRGASVEYGGTSYQVISAPRPDAPLVELLSPAEYVVARLLVEGKSRAEIAVWRRTSVRTVANQLAAVFHRLGVSGRNELLHRLLELSRAANEQLQRPSQTIECA